MLQDPVPRFVIVSRISVFRCRGSVPRPVLSCVLCSLAGPVNGGWGIRLVDVGFGYPGQGPLFEHVEFSINQVRVIPLISLYVHMYLY